MRFPFSRTSLATVRVIHREMWVLLKALGSAVIQRGMTGAQMKTMELEEEDGKTDSLGIKSVGPRDWECRGEKGKEWLTPVFPSQQLIVPFVELWNGGQTKKLVGGIWLKMAWILDILGLSRQLKGAKNLDLGIYIWCQIANQLGEIFDYIPSPALSQYCFSFFR